MGVGFAISSASCASVPPPSLTCSKQKEPALQSTNERFLRTLDPEQVDVIIRKVQAAEVDEMWSFVGKKSQQHWLWHAIDHLTGQVLAYVFGAREDEVFLELKALLEPFGITRFYTDGWGAYISATLILPSTPLGNSIRKRLNANTRRCVPGSNAWCG